VLDVATFRVLQLSHNPPLNPLPRWCLELLCLRLVVKPKQYQQPNRYAEREDEDHADADRLKRGVRCIRAVHLNERKVSSFPTKTHPSGVNHTVVSLFRLKTMRHFIPRSLALGQSRPLTVRGS